MYLVSSFDFGGSSHVRIHIVTSDFDRAKLVYDNVLHSANIINENAEPGTKYLVELTEVKDDETEPVTLYWGKNAVFNNNQS